MNDQHVPHQGLFKTGRLDTFTYTEDNKSFGRPVVFADPTIIQIIKWISGEKLLFFHKR